MFQACDGISVPLGEADRVSWTNLAILKRNNASAIELLVPGICLRLIYVNLRLAVALRYLAILLLVNPRRHFLAIIELGDLLSARFSKKFQKKW